MFSGIQEILLIVLILTALFLIPRMLKPRPAPRKIVVRRPAHILSWTLRLAIVCSFLWPATCALYFKPWEQDVTRFLYIGIGPVVLAWGLKWVINGMVLKR